MTESHGKPVYGPKNPTPWEMRNHALQKLQEATGTRPLPTGNRGSQNCYRTSPDGPVFHIYTNKPKVRAPRHRIYFFGNNEAVWEDHDSVLLLQCGLDFTVVAPIVAWGTYRDRMGLAQGGRRLEQHVHWEEPLVQLREREGFVLNLDPWVNNFDLDY